MAHFNQCSQLVDGIEAAQNEAESIRSNGEQYLDSMLSMQRALQTKLATEKPERNAHPGKLATAGEVVDWMRKQKDCIDSCNGRSRNGQCRTQVRQPVNGRWCRQWCSLR